MTTREYTFALDPSLDDLLTEDDVFFDIETTGLSKSTTILYLIGCAYKKDQELHLIQWFNEDALSEEEILSSFFHFLESFQGRLITFNGDSFDIPYLKLHHNYHMLARGMAEEDILCPLDRFESLDLYRCLKSFQHLFDMHHGKQKDWERFIGLFREDKYDGGQLIKVYKDYLTSKDPELLDLLLLHNMEDVRGMSHVMTLLAYEDLLKGNFHICSVEEYHPKAQETEPDVTDKETATRKTESDLSVIEADAYDVQIDKKALPGAKQKLPSLESHASLKITCQLPHQIPVSFHYDTFFGQVRVKNTSLDLILPVYEAELKHFYKNYKDYYYLPEEDMAVHKSVGCFVENKHRKKAKAATCFVRKEDLFFYFPRPHKHYGFQIDPSGYMDHFTLYKSQYHQKMQYITFDELFTDALTQNDSGESHSDIQSKKNDTTLFLSDVIKEIFIAYLEGNVVD